MDDSKLGIELAKFSRAMFDIVNSFDSFIQGILIDTLFDSDKPVVETVSTVSISTDEYTKSEYEINVENLQNSLNSYFLYTKRIVDKFLLYQPGVYAVNRNRDSFIRAYREINSFIPRINNWQRDLSDLGVLDESYRLTITLFKSIIRQCREVYNTFNKVIERYNIDNPTDRLELLTLPNKP
jgi:hypothetical protein